MELNQTFKDRFILIDVDGNAVTGEALSITLTITKPDGTAYGGISSVTEIGNGEYTIELTPTVEGLWSVVVTHPTHAPDKASGYYQTYWCNDNEATQDSIEGKIDIIDGNVDDIESYIDTMETDLKAYLDTMEDSIRGLDDRDLTTLYDYITSRVNAIISEVDDNEAKIDIIDGLVDIIHGKLPSNYIMGSGVITNKDDEIDAILSDTDTLETDIKTYLDGIESRLTTEIDANETKIDIIDTVVDAIKAVTDLLPDGGALTTIITHLTDIKGVGWVNENLTTIDSLIDLILEDTGTTLPATLSSVLSEIDSNETKIDTIQSTVDAILIDTDTLEADLKAYLDTMENNIRGLDNQDLTVLYNYLVQTKTDLTTEIDANEGKIDIMDALIDTVVSKLPTEYIMGSSVQTSKDDEIDEILTDTGTTLPAQITTTESNIRDGTDTLATLSDQLDEITPLFRYITEVPEIMFIPASGSQTYRVYIFTFDSDSNPEDMDSNPTISMAQLDGTEELAETEMTKETTGVYYYEHVIYASDPDRQYIVTFKVTENSIIRYVRELLMVKEATSINDIVNNIYDEIAKVNTDNTVYTNMQWENKRLTAVDIEYYSDDTHTSLIKTREVRASYDVYGKLETKTETTTYA